MIRFAVESWAEFRKDAAPLWQADWNEAESAHGRIALDPDHALFETLDRLGQLVVVAARDDDRLVGYWIGFVRPHEHARDSVSAYQDALYIDRGHRAPRVSARLLRAVERELRQRRVQRMIVTTKTHVDQSRLLGALGFRETERVFEKMLETESWA